MEEKIGFNGITYTIPNTLSPDGEALMLVNLRLKDGSLQPVSPPAEIGRLSQRYDHIYVLPVGQSEEWLGSVGGVFYSDILSSPQQICALASDILEIRHLGNTVMAITADEIYYFLYRNGTYIALGDKPPFPYFFFNYQSAISTALSFADIEGEITDLQTAMEGLHVKNRWREENAPYLCGAYLLVYALRLYDNSYILPSSPLFIYNHYSLKHPYQTRLGYTGDVFHPEYSSALAYVYQLKCTFHISDELSRWKNIVAGIDIFLSPELGVISDSFKKIEDCPMTIHTTERPRITYKKFEPQDFEAETVLNSIKEVSNFYLIRSVPLPEKEGDIIVTFPDKSDLSTLQNLVHQPTLPLDNFSHHTVTARHSYIYNQRLHIADTVTSFFRGFTLPAFNTYYVAPRTPTRGGEVVRPDTPIRPGEYFPELKNVERAYIEVYINVPKQESCVITQIDSQESYYLNAFFSYPDTRAYKAVIIYTDFNDNVLQRKEMQLVAHSHLNLAYYVDQSLQENHVPEVDSYKYVSKRSGLSIREEAKIKVSALQNPFVFPNENTYLASARIIGIATNTRPLSEGQFGQFPLYIFTTNGIYAMQAGDGEVLYTNIVPVSQEVALAGSVTPITDAVFFLTSRGAFLISAKEATNLSPRLDGYRPAQEMQFFGEIKDLLFPDLPNTDFQEFIKKADVTIHYNYYQHEIFMVSESAEYSFVFNLLSRSWHTITYTFTKVENTYPRLYGVKGDAVLDISEESEEPVAVLLLSRPIKFKTQQYKTLFRHVLRARLHTSSDTAFLTYASDDAENFRLKSNLRLLPGNYLDVDSGIIPAGKYRYFAVLFMSTLYPDSRINFLHSSYKATYTNDKLR